MKFLNPSPHIRILYNKIHNDNTNAIDDPKRGVRNYNNILLVRKDNAEDPVFEKMKGFVEEYYIEPEKIITVI